MIGDASLPARIRRAGGLEDAPVQFLGEMLGLQEVGDAVEGVVVDQDGAEQRLFRLDIGGRLARARIGRLNGERGGERLLQPP